VLQVEAPGKRSRRASSLCGEVCDFVAARLCVRGGFPGARSAPVTFLASVGVWGDCSVAASPEEGFERSCVFGPMADGADAPKQFGITKPLSLLGPVEADLQRTAELEKVRNCFSFVSVMWSGFFALTVSHSLASD